MTTGKFHLELTRSQQMALIDVIAEFIRESTTESFTDCSTNPSTVTTPGELLRLVSDAKYIPAPAEIPDTKARRQ
jgi:hypothetical protein